MTGKVGGNVAHHLRHDANGASLGARLKDDRRAIALAPDVHVPQRQAAELIGELLENNGSTDGWEGNEDERVDLKADGMDTNGNSVIWIADDDTVESLADEIHETGGGAARKLAQMLAPSKY